MIYGIGIEWGTAGEVGGVVSHGNGRQAFTPIEKHVSNYLGVRDLDWFVES